MNYKTETNKLINDESLRRYWGNVVSIILDDWEHFHDKETGQLKERKVLFSVIHLHRKYKRVTMKQGYSNVWKAPPRF